MAFCACSLCLVRILGNAIFQEIWHFRESESYFWYSLCEKKWNKFTSRQKDLLSANLVKVTLSGDTKPLIVYGRSTYVTLVMCSHHTDSHLQPNDETYTHHNNKNTTPHLLRTRLTFLADSAGVGFRDAARTTPQSRVWSPRRGAHGTGRRRGKIDVVRHNTLLVAVEIFRWCYGTFRIHLESWRL